MASVLPVPPLRAVLVYMLFGQEVLLAKKTRIIGVGRWNGYGGKLLPGETALQAGIRETADESGILLESQDLEQRAVLDCRNYRDAEARLPGLAMEVDIFLATLRVRPFARATEEMVEPTWFPISRLPLAAMIPSDSDWLPRVLAGERLAVEVHNGPDQATCARPTVCRPLAG